MLRCCDDLFLFLLFDWIKPVEHTDNGRFSAAGMTNNSQCFSGFYFEMKYSLAHNARHCRQTKRVQILTSPLRFLSECHCPYLGVTSALSNTLKTLSLATIPICRTLNLSAISRNGLNNKLRYNKKAIISPSASARMQFPPHQTSNPIEKASTISTTGKKTE